MKQRNYLCAYAEPIVPRHKRDSDSGAVDSGGSWLASGKRRAGARPRSVKGEHERESLVRFEGVRSPLRAELAVLKKKRGRLVMAFAITSL